MFYFLFTFPRRHTVIGGDKMVTIIVIIMNKGEKFR